MGLSHPPPAHSPRQQRPTITTASQPCSPLSIRLGIVAMRSNLGRRTRWLNASRAQSYYFRPFPLRILFPSQLLVHTRQQDMRPRLVRFPCDCLLQGCDRALGISRLHQSLAQVPVRPVVLRDVVQNRLAFFDYVLLPVRTVVENDQVGMSVDIARFRFSDMLERGHRS